ncbi:hypothetical protein [Pseudomonas gingeri]
MSNETKPQRPGREFWDKICSLKHYGFIHSPDNSRVLKAEGIGNWIDKYEAQKIVDEAQDLINQLRAERDAALARVAELESEEPQWSAMQQKLGDANIALQQRIDLLEGLLREALEELLEMKRAVGFRGQTLTVVEKLEAALKPAEGRKKPTCTWSHDGIGIWAGSCGTKWVFTDDGPAENGMRFCHSCGKTLVVEPAEDGDLCEQ